MCSADVFTHAQMSACEARPAAIPLAAVGLTHFMVAQLAVGKGDLAAELPGLIRLGITEHVVVKVLRHPPTASVEPVQWNVGAWTIITAPMLKADAVLSR